MFKKRVLLVALTLIASQALAQDEIGDVLVKTKVEKFSPADFAKAKPFLDTAMETPIDALVAEAAKLNIKSMLSYGFALEFGRTPATDKISKADKDKLLGNFADIVIEAKLYGLNDKIRPEREKLLDRPEFWEILAEYLSEHTEQDYNAVTTFDPARGEGTSVTRSAPQYKFGHIERPTIYAAKSCAMDARTFQKTTKLERLDPTQFKRITPEQYMAIRSKAEAIRRESWQSGIINCGGKAYFTRLSEFASQNLGPISLLKDDPTYIAPSLPDQE